MLTHTCTHGLTKPQQQTRAPNHGLASGRSGEQGPPHSPPLLQMKDRAGVREPAIESRAQNKKRERGCETANRTKTAKKAPGDRKGKKEEQAGQIRPCPPTQAWARGRSSGLDIGTAISLLAFAQAVLSTWSTLPLLLNSYCTSKHNSGDVSSRKPALTGPNQVQVPSRTPGFQAPVSHQDPTQSSKFLVLWSDFATLFPK